MVDIYDQLESERSDLDVYLAIARELGARSAVDVGCGTGSFVCLLASEGLEVVGVDPAAAMLAVARRKLAGDRVRWVHGVTADLPAAQFDLDQYHLNWTTERFWRGTCRELVLRFTDGSARTALFRFR